MARGSGGSQRPGHPSSDPVVTAHCCVVTHKCAASRDFGTRNAMVTDCGQMTRSQSGPSDAYRRIFVPFRASVLRGCRAHISRLWRAGCLCPGGLPQISPGITLRSLGEGMADLDGRGPRRGVLAHGHAGGCGSQCLALATDTDPRWAACSARTTLMRRSGGPVMAGSGRAGVEAGGSGTRGFRIKTKTRASPAFGPLV